MLGAPDEASPELQVFSVYRWTKLKVLLVPIPVGGGGPGLPIPEVQKQYRLLTTFDERGVVTQREVQEGGYKISNPLQ